MSFALDAKVCGRCLPRSDTSNKPLEWTGHQRIHACTLNSLPATQGQRWLDHIMPLQGRILESIYDEKVKSPIERNIAQLADDHN